MKNIELVFIAIAAVIAIVWFTFLLGIIILVISFAV